MSIQLQGALLNTLEAIQPKNIGDNQWFALTRGGDLMLRPRPAAGSCFYRIWLCISRVLERIACWARGRPTALEQRFIWLFDSVEEYLHEQVRTRNQRELAAFLNSYTTAINEVFRCATRMEQAGKISVNTLNHLRGRAMIQREIITNINTSLTAGAGRREYHPYARTAEVYATNKLSGSEVTFRAPGHRINASLSSAKVVFGNAHTAKREIFQSTDERLQVFADVTVRGDLPIDGNSYEVFFGGDRISKRKMEKDRPTFRIHNQSHQNMRVAISESTPDEGVVVLPQQHVEIIPTQPNGSTITIIAGYTLEQNLTLGCKLARYSVEVNESGALTSQIIPKHTVGEPQEVPHDVDAAHPLEIRSQGAGASVADLQILGGRRPYQGRTIIPQGRPLHAKYPTICGKVGVEPGAQQALRVVARVQAIESIIPSPA